MADIRVLLLVFLMQGLATFYIGLAIFGLKVSPRKIVIYGLIYGLADYIGKNVFMAWGMDLVGNLLPILFQFLVYRFVFRIRTGISIAASVTSLIIQIVSSLISIPILDLMKIDYMSLYKSGKPWNLVILGSYNALPLYLFSLLQLIKPLTIINFSKKEGTYL